MGTAVEPRMISEEGKEGIGTGIKNGKYLGSNLFFHVKLPAYIIAENKFLIPKVHFSICDYWMCPDFPLGFLCLV